ncbi:MAG TPA: hypothetical protein VGO11_22410 [Chthoniobacteraceae bacterium]|jgi:hypothetical protein|nr:hypothetical protein [Chthoniobacteraceae bacterium]
MSPLRFLLLAVSALWFITGCEVNRVLTIKRDGSGQITEHFMASRDSFASDKPEDKGTFQMKMPRPTAETLAKDAAKLGEGITVKSFKALETKEMMGYDAVYEFADINKLHADAFLQEEGMKGPGAPAADDASRNFKFTKGAVSELIVPIKAKEKKENPPPPDKNADPKQREAFFEALKHLNLRMAVRVDGKIVETNSHFRQGDEVVLSEMNLAGMFADPKYAQVFKDAAAGKQDLKEPPKDAKYLKKEEADVKIRFK